MMLYSYLETGESVDVRLTMLYSYLETGESVDARLMMLHSYLETGESVDVPDAEHSGCRQTDDMLVPLIARDVNDGEQVTHQFT